MYAGTGYSGTRCPAPRQIGVVVEHGGFAIGLGVVHTLLVPAVVVEKILFQL